jgi:hypothetical protein
MIDAIFFQNLQFDCFSCFAFCKSDHQAIAKRSKVFEAKHMICPYLSTDSRYIFIYVHEHIVGSGSNHPLHFAIVLRDAELTGAYAAPLLTDHVYAS